eukprot:1437134-Prymnesium_polylepis.2
MCVAGLIRDLLCARLPLLCGRGCLADFLRLKAVPSPVCRLPTRDWDGSRDYRVYTGRGPALGGGG